MLGALVRLMVGQFRSRASLLAENELLRQQLAAAKSRLAAQASDVHGLAAADDRTADGVDGFVAGDGDAGAAGHCASANIHRSVSPQMPLEKDAPDTRAVEPPA